MQLMLPVVFLLFLGGAIYYVYSVSAGAVQRARMPLRASLAALGREFGGGVLQESGMKLDGWVSSDRVAVLVSGYGPAHDKELSQTIYNPGGWYTMVHAECVGATPHFVEDGPAVRPDATLWSPERRALLDVVGPCTVTNGGRVITVALKGICTDHQRLRAAVLLVQSLRAIGAANVARGRNGFGAPAFASV